MIEYTTQNMSRWFELGPRKTVGEVLYQIGQNDPKVAVCCADVANRIGVEKFCQTYGERFLEVGISEQSMIGAAAGLSNEGFHACAIAYAPFVSSRILDQIRIHLGYMKSPVTILGLGGGLALGDLGATHTALEEVAALRAIPNLVILSPADCTEIAKSIEAGIATEAPVYIRLTGGTSLPAVYDKDYSFTIGKSVCICDGSDLTIYAVGSCVYHSLKAAELLALHGISCGVINMHTLKPLDQDAILQKFHQKLIVTVEEHNIIGGLGGAVAESLSQYGTHPPLLRLGILDRYYYADTYQHLFEVAGMTAGQIANSILSKWKSL